MTFAEMMGLARLAQKAQMEGRTQEAAAIQQRIRGAPGEVMADIALAGTVKQKLDAGDTEGARAAAGMMTGTSIRLEGNAASVGATPVPAAIAVREAQLAAAASAQGASRWWLLAGAGGVALLLALWWVWRAPARPARPRRLHARTSNRAKRLKQRSFVRSRDDEPAEPTDLD